jgi:hypothetical protein
MASSSFFASFKSTYFPNTSFSVCESRFEISQVSTAINVSPKLAINPSAFCSDERRFLDNFMLSFVTLETLGSFCAYDFASSSIAALFIFILFNN